MPTVIGSVPSGRRARTTLLRGVRRPRWREGYDDRPPRLRGACHPGRTRQPSEDDDVLSDDTVKTAMTRVVTSSARGATPSRTVAYPPSSKRLGLDPAWAIALNRSL